MDRLFEWVLAALCAELLVVLALRRGAGWNWLGWELCAQLGSAACLVAAAIVALRGAPPGPTALCLLAALAGHAASLALRWRARRTVPGGGRFSIHHETRNAITMKLPVENRRSALVQLLTLGAGAAALARPAFLPAAAPALVPLSPADPTAKALGYTEDSSKVDAAANPGHKPEQKCANCAQFLGKPGDPRGGCNIYAGKSVSANGWCKVYAKKPG